MGSMREVMQSPIYQGVDEKIIYALDTTNWGNSPSSASCKIFAVINGEKIDTSSTNLSGSTITVSGNVITLPAIQDLTIRTSYRLEITFTINGSELEAYANIIGEE